jgi:hypothetical protein
MKKRYQFGGPPPPADSWQLEFKKRSLAYMIEHGTPVGDGDDSHLYYGYIDHNWRELLDHLATCSPDPIKSTSIIDKTWTEFAGTFADRSEDLRHGLELTVTCSCGKVRDKRWRLEKGFGELVRALTGT